MPGVQSTAHRVGVHEGVPRERSQCFCDGRCQHLGIRGGMPHLKRAHRFVQCSSHLGAEGELICCFGIPEHLEFADARPRMRDKRLGHHTGGQQVPDRALSSCPERGRAKDHAQFQHCNQLLRRCAVTDVPEKCIQGRHKWARSAPKLFACLDVAKLPVRRPCSAECHDAACQSARGRIPAAGVLMDEQEFDGSGRRQVSAAPGAHCHGSHPVRWQNLLVSAAIGD